MNLRDLVEGDELLERSLTGRLDPDQRMERTLFEKCTFDGCVWDEAEVRSCEFTECLFTDCSVSLTNFTDSRFAECTWRDCRILSVDWAAIHCNPMAAAPMIFAGCRLTYSRFVGVDLRRWRFDRCDLTDADFSDARLSDAVMHGCDLRAARFVNADMRRLDLSTSFNYLFDVRNNKVAGLRVSAAEAINLLEVFDLDVVD